MTRKSEFIGDTKGLPLTPQVKAFGLAGLAALGFSLAACGNGSAGSATGANETPTRASTQASPTNAQGNTVDVSLIGKIDATSGTPGTFTGKDGWPALAPANFTVPHGARVVLTIREFDDMNTPLRPMMPYNTVEGGAETVDGSPVTSVDNAHIAHTFTVPSLMWNGLSSTAN
ncbi:MAG: hypothetical protein EPN30_03580 [Actinomycetota bacterium]|nr:MAG: hypothetical protein EPN30_03580 [Actinomycetota bacterium]